MIIHPYHCTMCGRGNCRLSEPYDMAGYAPREFYCQECFPATDTGPCFDDVEVTNEITEKEFEE